jgi:hypothetical protein
MSRSIKKISNMCVAALVDADEMTQSQADRLRQRTKAVKHPSYKKVAYPRSKKKH